MTIDVTEELKTNKHQQLSQTREGQVHLIDGADEEKPQSVIKEIHDSSEDVHENTGILGKFALRFPRSFSILFRIVVPLFVLISLCFAFGACLATIESHQEKAVNDQILSRFQNLRFLVGKITERAETAPEYCLGTFNDTSESLNRTALEIHMKNCGQSIAHEDELTKALNSYLDKNEAVELKFNWITCVGDNVTTTSRTSQTEHFVSKWNASYYAILADLEAKGFSTEEAHEKALMEATGSGDCDSNCAAGALFWFTVMTTIGYGNTAPVTIGGRALVYTAGFMSILVFTALVSQAGYVCVTVVDDMFLRCRMGRFTKGPLSVIFWLCTLISWILVTAGTKLAYSNRRKWGEDYRTILWFTYVSITTVGFGDHYIQHETFEARDLFYIPVMFLIGFVVLANFLWKFSDFLAACTPHKGPSLETILEETRTLPKEEGLDMDEPRDPQYIASRLP